MVKQIQIPTTCPSCQSALEQVNSQLFCRNKDCSAQSSKRVEAFVKKMRIKGLGPASISKLGFTNPIEIYDTHLDTFVEVLGEKIGKKIYDEVQNSTLTAFSTFLSALSIPLIGDTASKKVSKVASSLGELFDVDLPIGEKATYNLLEFLAENENSDLRLSELEKCMTFGLGPQLRAEAAIEPGSMGKVCITGKLNDFSNRAKAKEFLEDHGYTVTSTVSGATNYLVCEDESTSSKRNKAESLGVPVVTIENLIN